MNAIQNEMLEMLVRGGLLLLAAFVASFALRGRGAALVSAYWRVAILAVLLVPTVPKLWTLKQSLGEVPVRLVMDAPALSEAKNSMSLAVESIPVSADPFNSAVRLEEPAPLAATAVVPETVTKSEPPLVQAQPFDSSWILAGLAGLWLLGAVFVFGRWLLAALRFRLLWQQAVPAGDASLREQFRAISGELGLRRAPRLMTHSRIAVPMAGGLFRARVLLPNDCARWAEEDRRMVLMHELVHVKRHDALFHLLASLAKALHWANPLVWVAVRQMRAAAERATDDRVLETGTGSPQYARLLVEFASRQMGTPSPGTPAAASSMAKPDTVEARVRRILDPGQRRARPGWFAATMLWCGFAGLLVLAGGIAFADDKAGDGDAKSMEGKGSKQVMVNKLAEIVLPEVDFTEATLEEAIEFCSAKSRELDPEGRGLNIIATPFRGGPAGDAAESKPPTISLQLSNIPLGELLRYMARLSHMQLSVERHSVVFRNGDYQLYNRSYEIERSKIEKALATVIHGGGDSDDPFAGGDDPFGGGGRMEPLPPTARDWLTETGIQFPEDASAHYEPLSGRLEVRNTLRGLEHVEKLVDSVNGVAQTAVSLGGALRQRGAKIVVPAIDFTEASLDEAIDYLRRRSGELSPDGPINLLVVPIDPRGDGSALVAPRPITLKLDEIPFEAALQYVAEFSDYHVQIDPHAIVLAPMWNGDSESFELRSFPIKHLELRKRLASNSRAARDWLTKLGVSHSRGASSYFEPIGSNLIVRNRSLHMSLIEATLRKIEESVAVDSAKVDEETTIPADPLPEMLTEKAQVAARVVVVLFHSADTIEKRLEHVRDPERVRPLMEAWYAKNEPMVDLAGMKNIPVKNRLAKLIEDQGRNFVILAMSVADSGQRLYAIEETADGMKLDWETAVGYQPMPLEEFKDKRPTEPVPFRVKMKSNGYQNDPFSDKNQFMGIELSYPGLPDFKLYSVIDRKKEWTKPLFEAFDKGLAPSVIAKLKYRSGATTGIDVEIDSIVAHTWWPKSG